MPKTKHSSARFFRKGILVTASIEDVHLLCFQLHDPGIQFRSERNHTVGGNQGLQDVLSLSCQ